MVSPLNLDEKYNRVRRNFCFYLDIQDHGLARSLSRRIQDIGLQQEVFLTSRVSHVVRSRGGAAPPPAPCPRRESRRADAMLERVRASHLPTDHHKYVTLSVQKAINLLDKLYDTFFTASRKSHVRLFTKHFIKIEFLDKLCRPVYKEFDEWPAICLEPDPPRERKDRNRSPDPRPATAESRPAAAQRMTRKSRPRIKEKDFKEPKGGYCEMCNAEYADAGAHRRSPHHLAFVRDAGNYLALDSLIAAGADVAAFLDKAAPVNGERRSLRKLCNGDARRDRSADSGSPRRARRLDDDKQYYKVVGVGAKLRSGAAYAKRKRSPPTLNGAKPLVVKFRKVRRSELSVLSDEAEQFMFPRRASSSGSGSGSSDSDSDSALGPKRKSPARPPPAMERRRLARPLALKEESSEDDAWPDDARRRKRRAPAAAKRARRPPCKTLALDLPPVPPPAPPAAPLAPPEPEPAPAVSPLREEAERCMKWEDGRLKYTPAVERLEFAFESVPRSEPWYETFQRQDQDRVATRNVPRYFALYSTGSPKLPYEIGQLPPLKPNCCPLSDLVKQREEKPGPSRSYGTRGMKKQKIRKRTAALLALEGHPRKSPREHASTLAILGSAGLLQRRRLADDGKSTASEDTVGDSAALKPEPAPSEAQEASERLRRFLADVFSEAAELDDCDAAAGHAVTPASNQPDVSGLFSECDACDLIRDELRAAAAPRARRARVRKKNRTGWPDRRRRKDSRAASSDSKPGGGSSADTGDDTAPDTLSEPDTDASERTLVDKYESEDESRDARTPAAEPDADSCDRPLEELRAAPEPEPEPAAPEERAARSSGSSEERELRKRRRALAGLCDWLQPVVRVARVDPAATRRLRSAARPRPARTR